MNRFGLPLNYENHSRYERTSLMASSRHDGQEITSRIRGGVALFWGGGLKDGGLNVPD
jgi:hypothetical protein